MFLGLSGKVLGGILAVIVGIYFGTTGKDARTIDEIEEELLSPGRRKQVRRSFMPLDMLYRRKAKSQLRGERARFRTVAPEYDPIDPRPNDEGS